MENFLILETHCKETYEEISVVQESNVIKSDKFEANLSAAKHHCIREESKPSKSCMIKQHGAESERIPGIFSDPEKVQTLYYFSSIKTAILLCRINFLCVLIKHVWTSKKQGYSF